MTEDDPLSHADQADAALSNAASTAIAGPWIHAVVVARRSRVNLALSYSLYGCPEKTTLVPGSAFQRACRAVADAWPTGVAPDAFPLVLGNYERPPGEIGPGAWAYPECAVPNLWWGALLQLDSTALRRARRSRGPRAYDRATWDAVFDGAVPLPLPPSVTDTVGAQILRQAGKCLPAAVGCMSVDNRRPPTSVPTYGGCIIPGAERQPMSCRSGAAAAAARAAAMAAHQQQPHASSLLFLVLRDGTAVRCRATLDGEAAVRFLHVTERARLRALGMIP